MRAFSHTHVYIHTYIYVCVQKYISSFMALNLNTPSTLEFQEAGRGIGYLVAYGHRDKDLIANAIQAWPASIPYALKTLCISLRKMQSDNDAAFRSKLISLLAKDEVCKYT